MSAMGRKRTFGWNVHIEWEADRFSLALAQTGEG